MHGNKNQLGILTAGGPAPGINSVISACTVEAFNSDVEVFGIFDGFKHLVSGNTSGVRKLTLSDVASIHTKGGSILRTSRVNPTKETKGISQCINTLAKLGINRLVSIGGDDTASSASEIAKISDGSLKVAHVPKTIDNDLPLPSNMPTFGFETARYEGTQTALNLMTDAETTNRWYIVVAMGRNAGHLALGIGKSAGATITTIPEEFQSKIIRLDDVLDVLEGAILKRRIEGHRHGLAVVSEGVAEKIDLQELASFPGVEVGYDPHGHLKLSEVPLATMLRKRLETRFKDRNDNNPMVDITIGYEMRSAPPIPFDIDYTQTLGYAAVRFLLSPAKHPNGGLVCQDNGRSRVIPFEELHDPSTGKMRVRRVDVCSQYYSVARRYMTRIEQSDLSDPTTVNKLAQAAQMDPGEFKLRFSKVV